MHFVKETVQPAEQERTEKLPPRPGRDRLQRQETQKPVLEEVIESISTGPLDERHTCRNWAIGKPKDQPGVAEKEKPPKNTCEIQSFWSERRDLNPRPHGPEPCALNQAAPLSGHFVELYSEDRALRNSKKSQESRVKSQKTLRPQTLRL